MFKVGDAAVITHRPPHAELYRELRPLGSPLRSWANGWVMGPAGMDGFIGQADIIGAISPSGIYFNTLPYGWPPQALRKVPKDKDGKPTLNV